MVKLGINSDIIENINLVIFDKDGTLMDLYNYWSWMIERRVDLAKKKFGFDESQKKDIMYAMGVDLENHKLRREGPVGLKKREIVMQAMIDSLTNLGFTNTYDFCCEIFKEVDRISLDYLSRIIKPIKSMHKLITTLYKSKCNIAIATTDKTERAKLAIKFLGILDKVNIIVGEDMVRNYKPFPDMIHLILDKLSVDKNMAVMVGDAVSDIEMGINAGLKAAIAVCSGLTSKEKFLGKTKYILEDISYIKII